MKADYFTFDGRPTEPLQICAVRYRPDNPPADGVTLILGHAVSVHKETNEPLVQNLFDLQNSRTGLNDSQKILEAWSFDLPNHGQSAVLNEKEIETKYPDFAWSGFIFPRALHAFLLSRPDGVDFTKRRLVFVGHSFSGSACVLFDKIQNDFHLEKLILLDAAIGPDSGPRRHMSRVLAHITWTKRDCWPGREAAKQDLGKQPGIRNWHPDVLKNFIEKGLRDHPASKIPDPWRFKGGVTLACSRANECATNYAHDHHETAFEHLHALYRDRRQVHHILSGADEFDGAALKEQLIAPEPQTQRGPASVQRIEKGGHMFVQTNPKDTASAIWNILAGEHLSQSSEVQAVSASVVLSQGAPRLKGSL
ncbi:hypothetical protein SCHPADRAFT_941536 [Schizopora paradoxa]|uniref:AB hydrolase-1 domain-containing protein n=1 Tax=Schizopora paradoxa TaxID=27342 RepID=A0A0H2RJL3_9AGAM|nr:hypothetical protein SCHPADRAFT_941536 [Schizopora paradoxa]